MAKKVITCKNRNLEGGKRRRVSELDRSDLDSGCMNCYFMIAHRGDHWVDDWARCNAPLEVKYGDKLEVTEAVRETVRRVEELAPKGEYI